MDLVIRSIRTQRPLIASSDQIEVTEGEIVKALLSKESVFDGETNHTFEDVLQSIWAVDSDAEVIDAELRNIAMGDSDSIGKIKTILTTAAEVYAQQIAKKVVEHRRRESIEHFVENTDFEEFQKVRGCL
jgi:hypothetical protein